jgi:hypothetical protein
MREQIYNSYLYHSRAAVGKPFKARRDFSKMSEEQLSSLDRIERLFRSYRHINIDDFIRAGFKMQPGIKFIKLSFFHSAKAKKCYTLYMKEKELISPDSKDNKVLFDTCKESIKNIYLYCKSRNITLDQYKYDKDGATPTILLHLKEHKVNLYTLHGLEIDYIFRECDKELLYFIFSSDFDDYYRKSRDTFIKSKELKEYIRKGLKIVQTKLLQSAL